MRAARRDALGPAASFPYHVRNSQRAHAAASGVNRSTINNDCLPRDEVAISGCQEDQRSQEVGRITVSLKSPTSYDLITGSRGPA